MAELRCENKLHGTLKNKILEVKCGSSFCGAGPGVTVLHRFDAESGAFLETMKFKDPRREDQNG